MNKPTGKLKFAYETIARLDAENERLREALCAYQREEKASMAKLQAEQALKPTQALKDLMAVDDLEER